MSLSTRYKLSRYNVQFERPQGSYLWNTLTGALVKVDEGAKGYISSFGGENDGDSTVKVSTAAGVVSDKPQYFFLERYMASFVEEMKQFIAAIVEDKEVPVGIHAGLMSVVLAKAAKKSLDEHRPIKIEEIVG